MFVLADISRVCYIYVLNDLFGWNVIVLCVCVCICQFVQVYVCLYCLSCGMCVHFCLFCCVLFICVFGWFAVSNCSRSYV